MEKSLDKSCVLNSRGKELLAQDEKSEHVAAAFCRLFELARVLRSKNGCPWDRKQTPRSMRGALVEETFEALDAITEGDAMHSKEELGDLFFNPTLVCTMFDEEWEAGEKKDGFAFEDALDAVCQKLIRRHPHVFESEQGVKAESVPGLWDSIKENVEGRKTDCVLDSVPKEFPPLLKACKFQRKAAKKGFDWPDADSALAKMNEELGEVKSASLEENSGHLEEECGDLLFAAVNYVQKLGVDPVLALERANKKFYERCSYVQHKCEQLGTGKDMASVGLEQMEAFWKESKRAGN
ncbi:MAG: nucleoside triphosphate pyrophosphohydrolase [Treponema sp.]|nr:nucleoside triphosphate pyrophosphohydrolase [Treponema sp.]